MSVSVTYWIVVKVPDGTDMSWDGLVTFNQECIPHFLKEYAEQRTMQVPERTFQDALFDPRAYYEALHPKERKSSDEYLQNF